LKEIL
jgi:hypothetical protein